MSSETCSDAPEELAITRSGSLGIRWHSQAETSGVLPAGILRAASPSAEMRHGDKAPQTDDSVRISDLELVGHYGLRIIFDDGHDSGIYTWEYLADLFRRRKDPGSDA